MTALEITKKNVEMFYNIGKAMPGRGYEIFGRSTYVGSSWGFGETDEDRRKEVDRLKKVISQFKGEVFVTSITIYNENVGTKTFSYDSDRFMDSLNRFDIDELVENEFHNVTYISMSTVPKFLGYVPLTGWKSDFDSQKELVEQIVNLDDRFIVDGFYDTSWDEPDDFISFDSHDSNGDYSLVCGGSSCQGTDSAKYFDGRVYEYNDSVVDSFWSFDVDCLSEYMKEIDPQETISIYHRKGKDWYIAYQMDQEEVYLTYRDDDGDIIEDEEFFIYTSTVNEEARDAALSWLEGTLLDINVKGYIYNNLDIGSFYGYSYLDDHTSSFNLDLIKREFDDLYEVAFEISDYASWEEGREPEAIAEDGYERWLRKNIDENGLLFGKYSHFKKFKEIVEKEGKTITESEPYSGAGYYLYAVSYGGEEYHLRLREVFDYAPKRLYERVSKAITQRLLDKKERSDLVQRSKFVFVGLEDSTDAGNCMSGTKEFCRRFGIDTSKIGGVRGDIILSYDYNNFTRRAVMQAINRQMEVGNVVAIDHSSAEVEYAVTG